MKDRQKGTGQFPLIIEYLVIIAIVLVVVQTVLNDLTRYFNWSHSTVVILTFAGFFFDLLFTVEFSARSIISLRRKEFTEYFLKQRGWIDFLASIPLLLLASGPAVILYIAGTTWGGLAIGFLSVLKTAKAVRVPRILHLTRMARISDRVEHSDSVMTNRHVATVSTISIVVLLLVLLLGRFAPFMNAGDPEAYLKKRVAALKPVLATENMSRKTRLKLVKASDEAYNDIIYVKHNDSYLFENNNRTELIYTAYPGDNREIELGPYAVAFSYHPAEKQQAEISLLILAAIVLITGANIIFYSHIFSRQVSDPVEVMHKGLIKWDYDIPVHINKHYSDDEIFRLAQAFNNRWLPLKKQIRNYRNRKQEDQTTL